MCARPAVERYKPFCSKRCADVELHRWLSGGYAIPAVDDDDPQGDRQGDRQDDRQGDRQDDPQDDRQDHPPGRRDGRGA